MQKEQLSEKGARCFNREEIAKDGAAIPTLPLLAIRGHLCFRCLQPAERLLRCAGCHRCFYCSKECQKKDWQVIHKLDCRFFKKFNEIEAEGGTERRSWNEYCESLYENLVHLRTLKKDMSKFEILQGQAYCSLCYRSAANLANGTRPANLKACEQCKLVSACSGCSLQHSTKVCKGYQEINRIELFSIAHFELTGDTRMPFPTNPRSKHKALSSITSWANYYLNLSNLFTSITTLQLQIMHQDLSLENFDIDMKGGEIAEINDGRRASLALKLATTGLTRPVSVMAAIEDIGLINKENIVIHIIGAAVTEIQDMGTMEELLHQFPSFKQLEVFYIGPDLLFEDPNSNWKHDANCCLDCKSKNRRRPITLHRALYHDFARTSYYVKPDLAVLFHSGRSQSEVQSWAPTTRYLLDSGITTLCTTYTKREAMEERRDLRQLDAKLLVEPEINRWRSLIPLSELMEGPEHGVYYNNYYRYIFRGTNSEATCSDS